MSRPFRPHDLDQPRARGSARASAGRSPAEPQPGRPRPPAHRPGAAAAFVVDIHRLGRQAGASLHLAWSAETPELWGNELIGLPAGRPLDLTLELEAVGDGVLVTGQARYRLVGQCCRCLRPLERPAAVGFQELFVYPGRGGEAEDLSRTDGESLDLTAVVRDAVVLDLPWTPLCEDDCAGLCVLCGANLNEDPSHSHAAVPDARWAGLSAWVASASAEPGERG